MQPTVADKNNNPGNIRDPKTGAFRTFASPQEGYAALLNDLQGKVTGATSTGLTSNSTLLDFAKKYAPSSDNNNPAQYTVNLANSLGIRPDTTLGALQPHIGDFAQAIAKNEGYTAARGFSTKLNLGTPAQPPASTLAPTQPTDSSGVAFPSSPNDNPLTAGLKTIGNLPGSAFNFAKGIVSSLNPLNTLSTIGQIGSEFSNPPAGEDTGQLIRDTITGLPAAAFHTLVPQGIQKVLTGDLAGAAQQFTNDPFGQVAPVVLALEGGAKAADAKLGGFEKAAADSRAAFTDTGIHVMPQEGAYTAALDAGISKLGGGAISTIKPLVAAPLGLAGGIVRSAASHLIGLEPTDITNIIQNPKAFNKIAMDQASRGGLANEFGTAVDTLEGHLQDTGAGYNSIRANETPVAVPENFFPKVLNRFGLDISPEGQVTANTKSITRNPGDIRAIQQFVDNWNGKATLTPEEYLNMRSDLGDLSRFDLTSGKTKAADTVGKALYAEANDAIRPQIKDLKSLDEKYAPARKQFDQLKKDFLTKGQNGEYVFKDGAINKIANATGVGKDALLSRMEQVLPGISKKIQILKTIENIQKSYGNKVGNYGRALVEGTALLHGNLPVIIGAIISHPAIAVRLLRGYGLTAEMVKPVVAVLKVVAGDVNNLKIGSDGKPQEGAVKSPYVAQVGSSNAFRVSPQEVAQLGDKYLLKLEAPKNVINLPRQTETGRVADIKKSGIIQPEKPGGLFEHNQNIMASQKAAGVEPTGTMFSKKSTQGGFITAGKNANSLHPEDVKVMDSFIDYARDPKKNEITDTQFKAVEALAKYWDISMDKGLSGVASEFKKILDGNKKVKRTTQIGSIVRSTLGAGTAVATGLVVAGKFLPKKDNKK